VTTATPVRVDVERFADEGYLLVEDLLDPERDLDPVVHEYEAVLDRVAAEWWAAGAIASTYADLPFAQRFARILNDAGPAGYRPFDICLSGKITAAEPMHHSMHLGPTVFALITSPRLVDAVGALIGPEVLSNPIQHVRIKPPEALLGPAFHQRNTMVTAVEWHQDQGVALPEVDETDMLTVWFPVNEATIENGCLCVIPGSHREGLVTHCTTQGLHIPDGLLGGAPRPLPVPRGSVLFMHHLTKHSSLRNVSDGIRWSFDLRYHPVDQPTGRPWFPGFVARSRRDPASAVTDWRVWADLWRQARSRLAAIEDPGKFNRWTGQEPGCA
jgi:hypothetical protein